LHSILSQQAMLLWHVMALKQEKYFGNMNLTMDSIPR